MTDLRRALFYGGGRRKERMKRGSFRRHVFKAKGIVAGSVFQLFVLLTHCLMRLRWDRSKHPEKGSKTEQIFELLHQASNFDKAEQKARNNF